MGVARGGHGASRGHVLKSINESAVQRYHVRDRRIILDGKYLRNYRRNAAGESCIIFALGYALLRYFKLQPFYLFCLGYRTRVQGGIDNDEQQEKKKTRQLRASAFASELQPKADILHFKHSKHHTTSAL
jgi:hypothetical protein